MEANNVSGSTNSPIPKFSSSVSFQSQLFEGKLCYLTMILHSHIPPLHPANPDSTAPRRAPPGALQGCFTRSGAKEIRSVDLAPGEIPWKQQKHEKCYYPEISNREAERAPVPYGSAFPSTELWCQVQPNPKWVFVLQRAALFSSHPVYAAYPFTSTEYLRFKSNPPKAHH